MVYQSSVQSVIHSSVHLITQHELDFFFFKATLLICQYFNSTIHSLGIVKEHLYTGDANVIREVLAFNKLTWPSSPSSFAS